MVGHGGHRGVVHGGAMPSEERMMRCSVGSGRQRRRAGVKGRSLWVLGNREWCVVVSSRFLWWRVCLGVGVRTGLERHMASKCRHLGLEIVVGGM